MNYPDLDGIEIKCATYTKAEAAIIDEPDTYASATRKATSLLYSTPNTTTAPMAGVSTFSSSIPPPGRKVTDLTEKAVPEFSLCHNKQHGLKKCGYSLRVVYVSKHKPEKAKTQLEALNLGKGRHAKPNKNPRPASPMLRH